MQFMRISIYKLNITVPRTIYVLCGHARSERVCVSAHSIILVCVSISYLVNLVSYLSQQQFKNYVSPPKMYHHRMNAYIKVEQKIEKS